MTNSKMKAAIRILLGAEHIYMAWFTITQNFSVPNIPK